MLNQSLLAPLFTATVDIKKIVGSATSNQNYDYADVAAGLACKRTRLGNASIPGVAQLSAVALYRIRLAAARTDLLPGMKAVYNGTDWFDIESVQADSNGLTTILICKPTQA